MARGPLGARVFSLLLLLFSLLVVAGVGGPADLFLFLFVALLLAQCYTGVSLRKDRND
jgi:hypothetical protein